MPPRHAKIVGASPQSEAPRTVQRMRLGYRTRAIGFWTRQPLVPICSSQAIVIFRVICPLLSQ